MKKVNKYIIGGATGACLACIAYGVHMFKKFGGLKIEPDDLYFSDDEVKNMEDASRACDCRCKKEQEPCHNEVLVDKKPVNESKSEKSKTGIRNVFCKVFPDNKKYCNAIDDIIDVAYSKLDGKERNRLLIAVRDMLYEAFDELVPDEDEAEDDATGEFKFVDFDGKHFLDEEGNALPIDDLLDCEVPLAINLDKALETDDMDGVIEKILNVLVSEK